MHPFDKICLKLHNSYLGMVTSQNKTIWHVISTNENVQYFNGPVMILNCIIAL